MLARFVQAVLVTGSIVLMGAASSHAAVPVRVLILSNGGDHDTTPALRRILKETGRFEVRICESPVGLAARTLADFDVLVDNYSGPSLGKETDDAIYGFVESGKGLVVTHVALGRGAPVYWPAKPKGGPVSDVHFLDVKLARPKHPIVSGTNGFRTADAIPEGISTSPSAEVIAVAIESGNAIPVVTVSEHGKGRVVCLALGHDSAAIQEKEFAAIFAKSTEWAATAAVAEVVSQPKIAAVKALLITGGHDHDAEFYKLFDGYKELDQLPVDTSANAFNKDLRGRFDVVIMYDFSRDLDDTGKKNLRDFVESGGGIVVLHHALLNYQNWDWWDDEVVGGSYRLTNPSSSVKNDQQIYVTPTEKHPITAGIAPFHIQDEAYKYLRMSPKIRPLLTTDNSTSDTNLAWVGPLKGTRVVAIQLGHGTSAFRHPSYRALVHNSVLWAAGKTN